MNAAAQQRQGADKNKALNKIQGFIFSINDESVYSCP